MVLLLSSCGAPPASLSAPNDDAASAIRSASEAWDRAHNAGDIDSLMRLYAESAVSMPFERPALECRTAIEADFRQLFRDADARHQTTIVSLEVSGEWAIERGRYEFSMVPRTGGESHRESGKHIVVRRRTDDGWKIQWEIWNTDAPVKPAAN